MEEVDALASDGPGGVREERRVYSEEEVECLLLSDILECVGDEALDVGDHVRGGDAGGLGCALIQSVHLLDRP